MSEQGEYTFVDSVQRLGLLQVSSVYASTVSGYNRPAHWSVFKPMINCAYCGCRLQDDGKPNCGQCGGPKGG